MHMSTPTLCIPAPPHISCCLGSWPTQLPGPSHNWRCLFFIGIWNWRELSDMEEYRRRESFEINLSSKQTILLWSHWGSKIWDSTFWVPYTTVDVYFSLEYGRLQSPEPHSWIIQNMYGSLHSEVTILSTYSPLVKGSFTKKITLLQTFEAPGTRHQVPQGVVIRGTWWCCLLRTPYDFEPNAASWFVGEGSI